MKARAIVVAALLTGAIFLAVPAVSTATETWTLKLDVTGGNVSWSGNVLTGSFTFTQIIGYDTNGDPTGTYAMPSGLTGTVSFTSNPGYVNYSPGTKTLATAFSGGTISVTDNSGNPLLSASFDTNGLVATSIWRLSGGKYNASNTLVGAVTSATLNSLLATYFDIAPDASALLTLNWNIFGAAANTSKSLVVGFTSGSGNVEVQATPIPLPSAMLLFAPALLGLAAMRKRLGKSRKSRDSKQG